MRKIIFLFTLLLTATFASAQSKDSLKVSIFGDSYSTYEGYLNPDTNSIWYYRPESKGLCKKNDVRKVEQTWWYQVIQRLGAKLEQNNSYSGSTICYKGYDKDEQRHGDYSDRAFVVRSNNLGNPDLILVCGATNDCWAGAQLGKYIYGNQTERDLWTFRPAMAKMLCDLKMNYPTAKIIFIMNSDLKQEFNESIHVICKHYAVPCLDLHDIDKQEGHPSIKGMKAFADQVIEFLAIQK